jgi:competence protein ComEC
MFTKLRDFQKPKNPQSFDYAAFMQNRNVYKVAYEDHFIKVSNHDLSLKTFGAKQRKRIVKALRKSGFKEQHLQLIQALILGQKQAINKETYNDFAEVGVVHILAVSGLHVGIVLAIIQFLLKPLLRLPKFGRKAMVILSIVALWGFASLAGFSPSVLRASTMFTFLALGQLKKRKTNSINMLCLSAVFLLVFRPQLLFEVGFQLSYAAVFTIVLLYPVFSSWYLPKYKLPKILVNTAYVSLAAQIGVLPFQLYYFHQFPGLFLIGNIIVIPFLGLLLSGGIACIILSLMGLQIKLLVQAYSFALDALTRIVDLLSAFKSFLIQDIFFNRPMFLGLLITIFLFTIMVRDFRKKTITMFLLSALALALICIDEVSAIDQKSEFVIFHRPKATVIGVKQNTKLTVFADTTKINLSDYWLNNYTLINRIRKVEIKRAFNIFRLGEKQLLVIDSTEIYSPEIKADFVLLSGSPDIHLEKLIQTLQPRQIIVDAQNYRSYVKRWKLTAQDYGIPFHNTYENGYYNLSLD